MITNCLLWSIAYRIKNKGSEIKAEWDDELCWYHYYIIHDGFELHLEQKKLGRWTPLFNGEIRKVKLRKKNKPK